VIRSRQTGFSYIMVMAAVVIVGILAEAARVSTWRVMQSDREAELLFRGAAYRKAIESFYQSNGQFPRELEDLVKDPRSASRRHLRALYPDPMGRGERKEWMLVRTIDGGISGVASVSTDEPMKQANFPKQFEKFALAKSYSEWIFEYVPVRTGAPTNLRPAQPPPVPPVLKTF
jgi:type II secretory pathway pseudopilin PulG